MVMLSNSSECSSNKITGKTLKLCKGTLLISREFYFCTHTHTHTHKHKDNCLDKRTNDQLFIFSYSKLKPICLHLPAAHSQTKLNTWKQIVCYTLQSIFIPNFSFNSRVLSELKLQISTGEKGG
jgi:hypothetical protein